MPSDKTITRLATAFWRSEELLEAPKRYLIVQLIKDNIPVLEPSLSLRYWAPTAILFLA